jgi:hypothetical protein
MASTARRTRVPFPLIVLVVAALVVVGLLLAQSATSLFRSIVELAILCTAFAAIGLIGLFLWRRGDIRGPHA